MPRVARATHALHVRDGQESFIVRLFSRVPWASRSGLARAGRSIAALMVAFIAIWALDGCSRGAEVASSSGPNPGPPVEASAERGPVTLHLLANASQVAVGDPVQLAIEVTARRGVDVRMPEVGKTLGPFDVRGSSTPPDVPDPSDPELRHFVHRYTLVTLETGDQEIPALIAHFTDHRDDHGVDPSPAQDNELSAGPLKVSVTSVLGGNFDPAAFRDIKGALDVDIAAARRWIWIAAAILAGLGAAAAVVAWLVRRRRNRAAAPKVVIPPHLWALEQLDRLRDEQLLESRRLHEFYTRLSDIVRHYIERRFGLMAPERTTEEFLREVRHHHSLNEEQRTLLREFLRAADMVKFALHEPSMEDGRSALAAARGFVEQTAAPEAPLASAPRPSAQEAAA